MKGQDWKHQSDCLKWLHTERHAKPGSLLGLDMGTGKSRVAIRYMDGMDCEFVIILCPKVVVSVWPDQFKLHSDRNWYVHAVDVKKSITERLSQTVQRYELARELKRPFALVLNYDAAWRDPFAKWIMGQWWDAGIYDESHRIKAPGGKASRFVSRLKDRTAFRLALTGTPMPHSPLDLYAQWRALDTDVFGTSFQRFKSRYAVQVPQETQAGQKYMQIVGYQNEEELNRRSGEGTYVVRKRDVLDLPPVTHEVIPVELSPATMRAYREFEKELVLEVQTGVMTVTNSLTKLLRLQMITSGYIKTDEGELVRIGTEKRDAYRDLIEDISESDPIVTFARYHVDLDSISEVTQSLKRQTFELSGRMDGHEVWKKATGGESLAVQIQSGGLGIDLTRSAYEVFYSTGYSLGDYEQALAREDRPGQTRPVTVYHLVATGTVDEKVQDALHNKQDVVNTVMKGWVR